MAQLEIIPVSYNSIHHQLNQVFYFFLSGSHIKYGQFVDAICYFIRKIRADKTTGLYNNDFPLEILPSWVFTIQKQKHIEKAVRYLKWSVLEK